MVFIRRPLQLSVIAATLLAGVIPATAQSYPSRPIRLIVGFAAGGPTDVLARIIGGKMSDILGQQVVIENRTGASGNIATQFVVRAPNDGYTILMGANSNAVNESLFKNLGFNFAKDLIPVAPLAEAPTVLVVHPSLDVKSVKDLIDLAKARPGEIMYATAGKGTTTHLAGELFNLMANVKLTAVPYKGSGETTKDLLSGQIKVMFSPVPPVKALIDDGKLRGVASTGPRRSAVVPNLPTVAEEGLKDFDMRMWFGLMAPVGTPDDIIEKLSVTAAEAVKSDDVKAALAKQGYDPLGGSRQEFGAFIQDEIEKWGKVVATFGPAQQDRAVARSSSSKKDRSMDQATERPRTYVERRDTTDTRDGMVIDWDVPIPMDDGLILRADIYRPPVEGKYPVILSYGPYAKWLLFKDGYSTAWDIMVKEHPDVPAGSTNAYQSWEVVDPEKWVPDGYVIVRVDSRGAGRSPGYIDPFSPRETQDIYHCIEWAAVQPWSSGKIGMAGISYYAINQWQVAGLQPPHLAAICIWEGAGDWYRDKNHQGGILSSFQANWYDMQVKTVQHGLGANGPVSSINGDLVCGPEDPVGGRA